ncbi:MAG TPA: tripartite tricarboxylate transporter substrate-binding protein [Gemmataceae bacterium]|nr:tripartite tricarboxylate transporter substrate-binding protein [Gemmataceae bacterium]
MTSVSLDRPWRPDREIELIVGTPAGGGQDRPARALADVMAEQRLIDSPLKLNNIPGRGGSNGWEYLATRTGDPYVAAISSPTLISNQLLAVSSLDYQALTPLATLYTEYTAFVVPAASKISGAAELFRLLGSNPGELTIALATALGNSNHIALARVVQHAGGDIGGLRISVFDSARYALAELIEGRAQLATVTAASALPELQASKVRVLAVSSPQRLNGLLAEVPTLLEHGVDCAVGMWRGVVGAPSIPPPVVAFWNSTLRLATGSARWRTELARQYWADTYLSSSETVGFLNQQRVDMASALRDMGMITPSHS